MNDDMNAMADDHPIEDEQFVRKYEPHGGKVPGGQRPLSRDKFGQTIAERIKKAGEPGRVSYDSEEFCVIVEDEGGELAGQLNLDTVYQEYCESPANERETVLSTIVQIGPVRHKKIPSEFADVKPNILPSVRSRTTFEFLWLEQKVKGEVVGPDLPFVPVGDRLMAIPVYDHPQAIQMISRDQMDEWGVSLYEAMEVAKQNLSGIQVPIAKFGDRLFAVMTGDSYDASRLLLLDLIRRLEVHGASIAMVPHRELLLITGSEDEDGLAMMAALAEKAFEHPRYLSCTAMRLEGDEWVSWSPPLDHPHLAKFRLLEVNSLHNAYERQKGLLDALREKKGSGPYPAQYSAVQHRRTGTVFSYGLWSKGSDALLPKSHKIAFYRDDKGMVASGKWDNVQQIVGHLMEETNLYPTRYRVKEFPTDDQLAAIGNEMLS